MKTFGGILALFVLITGATANADVITKTAQLSCGDAMLTSRTTYETHVPPDDGFGWLFQSLTLRSSSSSRAKPVVIDHAPRIKLSNGALALADVVDSWACVHGAAADYIVLNVYCARDDAGGICAGQQEWLRILSLTGARPDAGYAPQDSRYMLLFARLGIKVDGLQMLDATGK
jgi:hypothetical protein